MPGPQVDDELPLDRRREGRADFPVLLEVAFEDIA